MTIPKPDHVPDELVRDVDHVFGADFRADPFGAYESLRGERVVWTPQHGGYWILTRIEDIRSAMQQHELFSSHPIGIPAHVSRKEKMVPLELDPPDHTAYRRVIAPLFAPKAVTARTAAIGRSCGELIDGLVGRGECEFVQDFAVPFPTRIFTNMLGLPVDQTAEFVRWNNLLLHRQGEPEVRRAAGDEINDYLRQLIADRRAEPREDLVSALNATEIDGRPIAPGEVQNICFMLFVAGLDTVTAGLSLAFRFLAENPGHRRQLVEHPELLPGAVEEFLRVFSFVNSARTTTRDIEFAGVQMRKGERVLASSALASNDPDEFPEPWEVRFDRPNNRHLAFGAGPHRCAGSHLARDEFLTVLTQWHERIPEYELAPGATITMHAGGVIGPDTVPMVWEVAR